MLTPNSIFHIFSNLFDHLDQASYSYSYPLLNVKFGPFVFCIVFLKINPKFDNICFTAYLANPILKNGDGKNLPKALTIGAGGHYGPF